MVNYRSVVAVGCYTVMGEMLPDVACTVALAKLEVDGDACGPTWMIIVLGTTQGLGECSPFSSQDSAVLYSKTNVLDKPGLGVLEGYSSWRLQSRPYPGAIVCLPLTARNNLIL